MEEIFSLGETKRASIREGYPKFTTMEELYEFLCRFYKFCNEKRLHSGIGYRAPDEFLREYYNLYNV